MLCFFKQYLAGAPARGKRSSFPRLILAVGARSVLHNGTVCICLVKIFPIQRM